MVVRLSYRVRTVCNEFFVVVKLFIVTCLLLGYFQSVTIPLILLLLLWLLKGMIVKFNILEWHNVFQLFEIVTFGLLAAAADPAEGCKIAGGEQYTLIPPLSCYSYSYVWLVSYNSRRPENCPSENCPPSPLLLLLLFHKISSLFHKTFYHDEQPGCSIFPGVTLLVPLEQNIRGHENCFVKFHQTIISLLNVKDLVEVPLACCLSFTSTLWQLKKNKTTGGLN